MVLTVHDIDADAIEIPSCSGRALSVIFKPDSRHLVTADSSGSLRQWRVDSGQEITPSEMKAKDSVYAAVVSVDGRWIVSGDLAHRVIVWNTVTHTIATEITEHTNCVCAVDVSSDSTRFASGSHDSTVRIFSIISGIRLVPPLQHDGPVTGVKFSPDGCRIASITHSNPSVRVYDAHSGNKLFDFPINVTWTPTTPLAWSSDGQQVFAASPGSITSLNTSTSSRSEWPIHNSNDNVSAVTHGRFIACAVGTSVSFWDYTSRQQICSINHATPISCISISRDGRYLACGHDKGITVHNLGGRVPRNYLYVLRASRVPLIQVSEAVLESWMLGIPASTESVLSEEIAQGSDPDHYALAARSLMRAHLREWETAIGDAEAVGFFFICNTLTLTKYMQSPSRSKSRL